MFPSQGTKLIISIQEYQQFLFADKLINIRMLMFPIFCYCDYGFSVTTNHVIVIIIASLWVSSNIVKEGF